MSRLRMHGRVSRPPGRGAASLDAIPGLSLSLPPGPGDARSGRCTPSLNAMPCMSPGPSSAGPGSGTARADGLEIVGGGVASGTLLVLVALYGGGVRRQRTHPPPMQGHGTTTWATKKDVRQSKLFAQRGLVLGSFRGKVLRFDGQENVLLVGPQRAGKGTGIIIPSLLELEEHTVVIDVRGETWRDTAGHRSTFSRCLKLALTQPGSVRFNPLLEIRKGTGSEFMDAAMLGEMLITGGHNKADFDHWERTAKSLITCGMLYEVHTRRVPTLAHLASFWSQPGRTISQTLTTYRADRADAPGGRAGPGGAQ